jgi:hypothetical protein
MYITHDTCVCHCVAVPNTVITNVELPTVSGYGHSKIDILWGSGMSHQASTTADIIVGIFYLPASGKCH